MVSCRFLLNQSNDTTPFGVVQLLFYLHIMTREIQQLNIEHVFHLASPSAMKQAFDP